MRPRVRWCIPALPGFPDAWTWDERGSRPPDGTTLTWIGARDVEVRMQGARPGSQVLYADGERVAAGSDVLRLPDRLLDVVGWHTLRAELEDDAGARLVDTHELGVVIDVPGGTWSLPIDPPPVRPWVRGARLAAALGAGAEDHGSLLLAIIRQLHRGIPVSGRRVRPTYEVDPRYLPDRTPPWDLQGFLDWLDADARGDFPIACDGAVALVALLGSLLGAEASAVRLEPRDPRRRMRFAPFHTFGTRATSETPMSVHQLVVVDRGAINPVILDATFDWDEAGVDPPLPLRVYLSRRLVEPVELALSHPMQVLPDSRALSQVTAREEPTPEVLAYQEKLAGWVGEDPENRAVWDTTRGGGATFRILDRRERRWSVVELLEGEPGVLPLPAPPARVTGRLPSSLPEELLRGWQPPT